MRVRSIIAAALLALGATALPATAQLCVGFSDVPDTSPFCPSVEWLKNRFITTGCPTPPGQPPGTYYCPGDTVTRLSMAAFMNRLGKAMTPLVFHDANSLMNTSVPGYPGRLVCQSSIFTFLGFPRTARLIGQFWGQPSGTAASFQGYFMVSNDGGTNWQMIATPGVQMTSRVSAASGQYNGSVVMAPPVDIVPGVSYRFGLFVDGVGVTYPFTLLVCEMEVTVMNANPPASPLDE